MAIDSTLDPRLVQAYRETCYRVDAEAPFTMQIDIACPELAAIHRRHRIDSSAFISACNPLGQALDDDSNARLHSDLGQALAQRSLTGLPGVGHHPSGDWPGEASYLVLGLDLEAARALGTRLTQNAIVWAGADAVPQLVLLR